MLNLVSSLCVSLSLAQTQQSVKHTAVRERSDLNKKDIYTQCFILITHKSFLRSLLLALRVTSPLIFSLMIQAIGTGEGGKFSFFAFSIAISF
jgi:hypothetical protein